MRNGACGVRAFLANVRFFMDFAPMTRLKLAYIFDQTLPVPAADTEQLVNTVSALSKLDYDCTLFIPASNTEDNPTLETLQNFYHVDGRFNLELLHSIFPGARIAEKTIHPLLCATLLRKKLRGFDLVYTRNIPAVAAALACRIPVMYDTYRPWPIQYHHVLRPLLRAFFADPKFIGAALHSSYARNAYTEMGIPENRTIVAHNGFNPKLFEPALNRSDARAALGLTGTRPIATYSGRMDPNKGIDSLLDLAEKTPECDFFFIGSDGHGPLETRAESLPNVKIQGWVPFDQLSTWLYASDILMLPISSFALKVVGNTVLPIKLYAYFAAKRAIFAPHSPDTAELLKDGVNACLVPQNAPAAALARFHALVRSPQTIEQLAVGAADTAKSLTWDARAAILDRFIRQRLEEIHAKS